MLIEDLWKSLDKDAAVGKAGIAGWLLRLARPTPDCPIFVGVELSSNRRAVMLRIDSGAAPARRLWPRSKGLEPFALSIGGKPHFGVLLKEARFNDVFTALAEDLVRRVGQCETSDSQLRTFLGQLARWQKFLSASTDGLGPEAQRGLWGELFVLREHLMGAIGTAAVYSWKGGEKAHQDFQLNNASVEVKTTIAKLPQIVRITSERQLDDTGLAALFLTIVALETREKGENLPALVNSLRDRLKSDQAAFESFEDQLLQAGYLDSHAVRYSDPAYIVRNIGFFRVAKGFPRLTEADMTTGVGDCNYALTVSACEQFRISSAELRKTLQKGARTKRGSKHA